MAEESVSAEEVQEGAVETQEQVDPIRQEFEQLRESNAQMDQKLNKLLSTFEPKAQSQRSLSAEQKSQLAKDPEAMIQYVENEHKRLAQEVENKTARAQWDSQAYQDFPALKSDKKFQNEVVAKMKEWTGSGLMPAETPKLVYEAANFIARGYKQEPTKVNASAGKPTSQAPSSTSMNNGKAAKFSDNDQRLIMAKNMGISGDRLNQFKKFLSESPEGYYERK